MRRASFTMIELLLIVGIIAVLAAVTVIIINPSELLKQSRDSVRINNLSALTVTLGRFAANLDAGSLGSADTLYVSIPDPSATSTAGDQCQGLHLSTSSLPSTWSYHCAASSTYQKIDGTGWVPVDFQSAGLAASMSVLPVDPTNTTSSGEYYTYAENDGKYEVTDLFESQKNVPKEGTDGGLDPVMYEAGTDLTLSPFVHGMVAYWKFDDGAGTTAADSSGLGNTGTLVNAPTWTGGKYGGALSFASSSQQYVDAQDQQVFEITGSVTVAAWFKFNAINPNDVDDPVIAKGGNYRLKGSQDCTKTSQDNLAFEVHNAANTMSELCSNTILATGTWYFGTNVYNASAQTMHIYLNGVQDDGSWYDANRAPTSLYNDSSHLDIGIQNGNTYLNGVVDNVRIYDRALSATEVSNLYANE